LPLNIYGGVAFLTPAPDGDDGQLHTPAALPLGENDLGTHLTGGWVNSKAGLNTLEKRKILVPAMNQTQIPQ
jgi:hypothetical protein